VTKKEFENIGKELAAHFPGFVARGQLLFARPINAILRAIFFDRSIDKRVFYAYVFAQPLFVPSKHVWFNVGWRIGGGSRAFDADDSSTIEKLRKTLKLEALPFLLSINSPAQLALAGESLSKSEDIGLQQAIAYAYARAGAAEKATIALDRLIDLMESTGFWQEELKRARSLKSQITRDPDAVQRQLDAWEGDTIRNLKLEQFR
jgi:hypothetical protein